MKFSVALPVDRVDRPELVGGAALAELARHVEAIGLDAVFVTDHPAPDDRWLAGGGHHAAEPTVALAFAAAATDTLRLHTNIYVLAYRNPFLAAKALGSLDVLSGGRLILGVAAGYLRPEFAAVGADFERRNDLTDEHLALLRRLWEGESVAGEGPGWRARGVTQLPQPGAIPPVWIGGNSQRAMRRAATLADGWAPFPTPAGLAGAAKTADLSTLDQLTQRIQRVREWRAEAGVAPELDVCCGAFSLLDHVAGKVPAAALVEEYAAMADAGVTWTTIDLGGDTVAERIARLDEFHAEVIAPLRTARP